MPRTSRATRATLTVESLRPEGLLRQAIALLEAFQAGPKACEENRVALDQASRALKALERRATRRRDTGAAGTERP